MATINTRIQLKYDTLANWNASTFLLKKGELAIVEVPTVEGSTLQPVMFKVGTGDKKFSELDWASAKAADVYSWAKKAGIEVIDEGTGNVVSNITWDNIKNALVITRIDVYTKEQADARFQPVGNYKTVQETKSFTGSTVKTATGVTQDTNGVINVTFEEIAFPAPVDISGKKDKQEKKSGTLTGAQVVSTWSQDEQGVVSIATRDLTPEDIGAQPAGNYKTKQTKVDAKENDGTKTLKISQNENGEITVEEVAIAFPVVTHPTVEDTAVAGQFVTEVDQTEGAISVTRKAVDVKYDSDARKIQLTIGGEAVGIGFDASEFIKDGMIKSVEVVDKDDKGTEGKFLKITWNTPELDDADTITYVDLTDLIDVYTAGNGISVENNVISHADTSSVANVTKTDRTYISGIEFDEFGHVTKVETGVEADQDLSGKKDKQGEVANKIEKAAHVLSSLTQDANGEIAYEVKELTPADIGAQPAGNYQPAGSYKTIQSAITANTNDGTKTLSIGQNTNGEISVTEVDIAFPDYSDAFAGKKDKQEAYSKELSGSKVVSAITQNENGEIVVTDRDFSAYDLKEAETSASGVEYLVFDCGSALTLID